MMDLSRLLGSPVYGRLTAVLEHGFNVFRMNAMKAGSDRLAIARCQPIELLIKQLSAYESPQIREELDDLIALASQVVNVVLVDLSEVLSASLASKPIIVLQEIQ